MPKRKQEIAVKIYKEVGISKLQAVETVGKVFECILDELGNGNNVIIHNFGTFYLSLHQARRRINPRKPGTLVNVPAKMRIRFKPGPELKARLARFL